LISATGAAGDGAARGVAWIGVTGGGVSSENDSKRGAAAGAGVEGRGWKNCVKPPSADAESEAPEEKPFMRGEPWAACGAGGASGIDLTTGTGGRSAGFASAGFTKIRVNSPGANPGAGFGSMEGAADCITGACIAGVRGGAAAGD